MNDTTSPADPLPSTDEPSSGKSAAATSPYQLVFTQGIDPSRAGHLGNRVVPFNMSTPDPSSALDVLKDPDLVAADTKTTALFVVAGSPASALVAYTAAIGFAGRFLDVAAFPTLERLNVLVATGRKIARSAEAALTGIRPQRLDRVRVAPQDHEEISTIVYDPADPLTVIDINAATRIRFARRVELVPPDDLAQAFRLFAAIAGLRSTVRTADRLPSLVVDPTSTDKKDAIDLESLRAEARQLRHQLKLPDPAQLVDPPAPDTVRARVSAARDLPMAPVLTVLGSRKAESGEYWHCPRPTRHANGDRNPSMKISANKVRCFVCDAEWVDPVALVMSVDYFSPTEAATLVARANAG